MGIGMAVKLRRLQRKPKMTLKELAQKVGISQAHMSNIENDKKAPSFEVLQKIAQVLDMSLAEFEDRPKTIPATGLRNVPVINKASCGQWEDFTDLDFPAGVASRYERIDTRDPNAFFVIAEGDSMVGERIQEGDLLLVSPNAPVISGDIVLAKSREGVMVKKFFEEEGHIILSSLNPAYEPVLVTDAKDFRMYKIVKVVVNL